MFWFKKSEKTEKVSENPSVNKTVRMSATFGADRLIERQCHRNLNNDTYVISPEGGAVVLCEGGNSKKFREGTISFMPQREYIFYFINTRPFSGTWGKAVPYKDPLTELTETVRIRCRFQVTIEDPELFIKSGLLGSVQSYYTEQTIVEQIRPLLDGAITGEVTQWLKRQDGVADGLSHLDELNHTVLQKLNQDKDLQEKGIVLSDLQIECNEDKRHVEMRESLEKRAYYKKRADEINNDNQ